MSVRVFSAGLFVLAVVGIAWATMEVLHVLERIQSEIHDVNQALLSVHNRLIEIRDGARIENGKNEE